MKLEKRGFKGLLSSGNCPIWLQELEKLQALNINAFALKDGNHTDCLQQSRRILSGESQDQSVWLSSAYSRNTEVLYHLC